jgi:2-polyprenyl-3-methyl-5-hydroxy-6-metoxy-1,4-benzoquinol methylase
MKQPHLVVVEVLREKSKHTLSFEDGRGYDKKMANAYSRTVADIDKLGSKMEILEVGCFTGIVSASLSRLGHTVTGSDIPFVLRDEANLRFLVAEGVRPLAQDLIACAFDLPAESFDLIVFNEVLEHLNFNPIPLLREFRRLLKPGGLVYCATPNLSRIHARLNFVRGRSHANPVSDLIRNLQPETGMAVGLHWREWTRKELIELFSVSGFSLVEHRYDQVAPNIAPFPRKQMIRAMYKLFPAFCSHQVGVFKREEVEHKKEPESAMQL